MGTVIERDENADFGPGKQKAFSFRVLANSANISAVRNPVHDRAPRLAEVVSLVDVRLEIVETMSIYRNVGGVRVMRRRVDDADRAPLGNFAGDVTPVGAVIGRHMNKSIIRAGPQDSLFHRRFSE